MKAAFQLPASGSTAFKAGAVTQGHQALSAPQDAVSQHAPTAWVKDGSVPFAGARKRLELSDGKAALQLSCDITASMQLPCICQSTGWHVEFTTIQVPQAACIQIQAFGCLSRIPGLSYCQACCAHALAAHRSTSSWRQCIAPCWPGGSKSMLCGALQAGAALTSFWQ